MASLGHSSCTARPPVRPGCPTHLLALAVARDKPPGPRCTLHPRPPTYTLVPPTHLLALAVARHILAGLDQALGVGQPLPVQLALLQHLRHGVARGRGPLRQRRGHGGGQPSRRRLGAVGRLVDRAARGEGGGGTAGGRASEQCTNDVCKAEVGPGVGGRGVQIGVVGGGVRGMQAKRLVLCPSLGAVRAERSEPGWAGRRGGGQLCAACVLSKAPTQALLGPAPQRPVPRTAGCWRRPCGTRPPPTSGMAPCGRR